MAAPVTKMFMFAAAMGGTLLAGPAMAGGCYGGGCYRYATTPPVFDTVQQNVLVRPPRTVYRTVPPVYDTVEEQVMVSPGGRFWQTSRGPGGELIGCWVATPPRFALRRRTVLVRPAETVPETYPPEYATVSRRVLVAPAQAGWVPVGGGFGGYGGYGAPRVGSLPDALGITGASSADVGVGLGFSRGSIYDGY
ncbi:hypothetical protein [Methylobacterium sp. J-076]|uniref:hypothetical protein n=1 Tax=Methylobacterium sp. J-076 TaxID=2836655 RepID=UPI001FBA613F|nr:hypothetical protein [Methylobacterium sp. J-076]MCJ2011298.1 hypothetical protein [Methylobacterium sp. J-076]